MTQQTHAGALPQGTRLRGGAFAVGTVLGHGGFGITYKGGDLAKRQYVAIKEFFPPGALRQGLSIFPASNDPVQHARACQDFLREATLLARFHHDGIVRVLDSFEENNTAYMLMEFLEGQTLGQRIAEQGKLEEGEVLSIGLRMAAALKIVHEAGLLHRDIKPDNIMLALSGRPTLIDFGTARSVEPGAAPMTQIVTPGYAPLEQYAAKARKGPATDIYALGATLYHALGGQQPVAATDRAADIPLPELASLQSGLTPAVCDAIMCALRMEFSQRPDSAEAFTAMLKGGRVPPAKISPSIPTPVPSPVAPRPTQAMPVPSPPKTAEGEAEPGIVCLHNKLEGHTWSVSALAFDPCHQRLVSVSHDRMIHVWDWPKEHLDGSFRGHEIGISAVEFSPDGAWITTGGLDAKVYLWDSAVERRQEGVPTLAIRQPVSVLNGCKGAIQDLSFSRTRRVLACAEMNALSLWDVGSGQVLTRWESPCVLARFNPAGSFLAVAGGGDGLLSLLMGETLQPAGQVAAHQGEITGLAFSPDGERIASSGADGFVRIWNASDGAKIWEQRPGPAAAHCVAWSPDSRLVASASRETVVIWTAEGAYWRRYTRHSDRVQTLAFAPTVNAPYHYVLASGARDKMVNICRIRTERMP